MPTAIFEKQSLPTPVQLLSCLGEWYFSCTEKGRTMKRLSVPSRHLMTCLGWILVKLGEEIISLLGMCKQRWKTKTFLEKWRWKRVVIISKYRIKLVSEIRGQARLEMRFSPAIFLLSHDLTFGVRHTVFQSIQYVQEGLMMERLPKGGLSLHLAVFLLGLFVDIQKNGFQ